MQSEPSHVLSAELIDELAFLSPTDAERITPLLENAEPSGIGAVVEYELFRQTVAPHLPQIRSRDTSLLWSIVHGVFNRRRVMSTDLAPQMADAIPATPDVIGTPYWTAFLKRVEMSSRAAGFPPHVSAGFAGAIGELGDNIVRHSDAPFSGIVAFNRHPNAFEYVVADTGIGMLASLRKAREFRQLRDDMEALPLAITPGVSRFGRDGGYGYGYRAVFLPLRAASAVVRLRSGRAVLTLSGFGPSSDRGVCAQRPCHPGVVVTVKALLSV